MNCGNDSPWSLPGLTLALLGLGALLSHSNADPILYATAGAGTSLVRIDVGTQKATTLGDFGVPGADAIAINAKGEAFTVTHGWPPGGDSQLARVDLATGQATPFGILNKPENFMGLGFAPDGTLYGVNAGSGTPDAGSLYKFDLATGAATKVGGTGGCFDIMDLAWAADGAMYGAVSDSLYRIDAATGQATLVTKLQGVSRVMGLAIDRAGIFYVSETLPNASLFRVDPATGATTRLFDTGVDHVHGLDTVPPPLIRPSTSFQHTAVFRDQRITLAINPTGVGPLTYQWRRDGQELAGQTNKFLTIAAVQPEDEADYAVEVSNPGGTLITPPARLWVVPPATEFQKQNFTNTARVRLPYFVHRPSDFDVARRYPLVVIIHGGGWHEGLLPGGFWDWPQVSVFASYRQQMRDPVILVYPTHRSEMGGGGWSNSEADLISELMDRLATGLPVEPDRIYVTGGSASFEVAARVARLRRERLAAALLHSGYVRPDPVLKGLPIWTFQSLLEGPGAGVFSGELRAWDGHPLHTEFKTASHEEVYKTKSSSPAVVEWLLAQRRGQAEVGSPVLRLDQPSDAPAHHTSATALDLTGKAHGLGDPVLGVTWENKTLNKKGTAAGGENWTASAIPLAAGKTNVIVITATLSATWAPGFEGMMATTFSDTVAVVSSPVRLSLARQGNEVILDWAGGVPPFAVHTAPTIEASAWRELVPNATPPVAVPAPTPMQFYRVKGQ